MSDREAQDAVTAGDYSIFELEALKQGAQIRLNRARHEIGSNKLVFGVLAVAVVGTGIYLAFDPKSIFCWLIEAAAVPGLLASGWTIFLEGVRARQAQAEIQRHDHQIITTQVIEKARVINNSQLS